MQSYSERSIEIPNGERPERNRKKANLPLLSIHSDCGENIIFQRFMMKKAL